MLIMTIITALASAAYLRVGLWALNSGELLGCVVGTTP